MSFQIMDDILDFQGTEEEFGKPVGNDLLQGTITLPVLLLIQEYPKEKIFQRLLEGKEDDRDLRKVIDMVRNSNALETALQVTSEYQGNAFSELSKLRDVRGRKSLEVLTEYVSHRRT